MENTVVKAPTKQVWIMVQKIEHATGKRWKDSGMAVINMSSIYEKEYLCIDISQDMLRYSSNRYYINDGYKLLSYDEYLTYMVESGRITRTKLLEITLDS